MKWWHRILIAVFAAFLIYFGQIFGNETDHVRYTKQWDFCDTLAIWLGIALFAGVMFAVDLLVRRAKSPLLRRIANHLFLFVGADVALGIIGYNLVPLWIINLLWIAVGFLLGISFAKPQWRIDVRIAKLCLIASPAVPLVMLQMVFWHSWPNVREDQSKIKSPASASRAATAAHPSRESIDGETSSKPDVFFFLFDEWSYQRSTSGGEFNASLENLRELAAQSTSFAQAFSPTELTFHSIPDYLFQKNAPFDAAGGKTYFVENGVRSPIRQNSSIFQAAKDNGYSTYLVGIYHSYRQMLGDPVDYCTVYKSNHGYLDSFLYRLKRTAVYLKDPLSQRINALKIIASRTAYAMEMEFDEEMLKVLAESPPQSLAFFHGYWLHEPYAINPDGSYHGTDWDPASAADYMRQLQYVDSVVGRIVHALKDARKFDGAVLIFTADHSFRSDPEPAISSDPRFKRHIPLVIKLPGQKTAVSISGEFSPTRLKPFLDAVFAGEKDRETLLKLLEPGEGEKRD